MSVLIVENYPYLSKDWTPLLTFSFFFVSSCLQGLLARGDLRGANVEKDEQQFQQHPRLPTMRLDDRQVVAATGPAPLVNSTTCSQHQQHHHLPPNNLTNEVPAMVGRSLTHPAPPPFNPAHPHHPQNGSTELVVGSSNPGNGNGNMPMRMSHSGSNNPTSSFPTSAGKSSASSASTLSSLGYISDDHLTMNSDPSSTVHHHHHHHHSGGSAPQQHGGPTHPPLSPYTPRSKSSLGAYSSLSSGSGSSLGGGGVAFPNKDYMVAPYIPKSRSQENLYGQSTRGHQSPVPPRPTSLGLSLMGGDLMTSSRLNQQQSISCPNCRKSFVYVRGEDGAFGPWFEHIKFCSA